MCMPGLFKENDLDKSPTDQEAFTLEDMPYILQFKNFQPMYEECSYCGKTRCDGCPVPFSNDKHTMKI